MYGFRLTTANAAKALGTSPAKFKNLALKHGVEPVDSDHNGNPLWPATGVQHIRAETGAKRPPSLEERRANARRQRRFDHYQRLNDLGL